MPELKITMLPTHVEQFIDVFKQYVGQNPVFYVDQEPELCIGCLASPADVKLSRCCHAPPPHLCGGLPQCAHCDCRVVWCRSCLERWFAARAEGPSEHWVSGRATCPLCRATFCLLDVRPALMKSS